MLSKALHEGGFGQIVILGAGYDSRAYRIPGIEKTQVFEVDHPNTSLHKKQSMDRILGGIPAHVHFVPIDFTKQDLGDELSSAGFDPDKRSFFIWEGVTNYLTHEAVDATLDHVRGVASGSRLIFTYINQNVIKDPGAFSSTRSVTKTLRAIGEPWTFGLDPADVPGYLNEHGMVLLSDTGSLDYRAHVIWEAREEI